MHRWSAMPLQWPPRRCDTRRMSAEPVAAVRRPDSVAGTLEEELLRLLGAGSKWVPAPVFVGALLIFAIAYDTAPRAWLFTWLIGVLSILVLRYFVLTRLPRRTDVPSAVRLRIAVLLSGLNGCAASPIAGACPAR